MRTRHMLFAAGSAFVLAACAADEGDPVDSNSGSETEAPERAIVQIDPDNDPRVWMEEVEGEEAIAWAEEQNEATIARLQGDERYEGLFNAALEIYQSEDRIPYGSFRDGYVYNFWQDATNTHGLWRRATMESYLSDAIEWDVILDLDALSEAEDVNWVWRGANCLAPDYDRCMVTLSDGGSDAAVRREFDFSDRAFVEGGFVTPEAKGSVSWVDENTLFVGLAIDEADTTESGYPMVQRRWERGTDLSEATEVIRGEPSDVSMSAFRIEDSDDTVYYIGWRAVTFFTREISLLREGQEPVVFPLPERASISELFQDQLIISLQEDWTPVEGGETYPSGALVSFSMSEFAATGELPAVSPVFVPGARQSLNGVAATRSALLVGVTENVVGGLEAFTFADGAWSSRSIDVPDNLTVNLGATNRHEDMAFMNAEGFLTPDTLYTIDVTDLSTTPVKSIPERFNAEGLVVEQREVASTDGEMIPYFVVRREDVEMNGETPTLLYGYGGFNISIDPSYSGGRGRLWLENGGAYVIANIRGGGEFGPSWHQAGLKTERQIIYDDFIAVAEDLIDSGLTSPRRLAVYGGSNGGLLTGVMYTQRPDLFNAVISAVPLLDMLRYHTLLAGASWIGEYGDPRIPEERAFLEQISPYHNVDANGDYPEIYIYTSTKDDRVHPGHARKMAHLLGETGHDVLYYENIEGGHSAAANLEELARRDAMLYVFLMQKLMD